MKKARKMSVIVAALALIFSLAGTALGVPSFFRASLPAWKGHTDILAGKKVSSDDQNAQVKCTSVTNERNGIVVWIDKKGTYTRVAGDMWLPCDSTNYTLPYSVSTSKDTELMLRGSAEVSMTVACTATGYVDFK